MALTYDAYNRIIEEKQIKDKEVESKNQIMSMQERQREILDLLEESCEVITLSYFLTSLIALVLEFFLFF